MSRRSLGVLGLAVFGVVLAWFWPYIEKNLFTGCPWPFHYMSGGNKPSSSSSERLFTLEELRK